MKSRKAQGLSLNTIIIAALALIVLVVLSVIFIGKTNQFSQEVKDCRNKGGKCFDACGIDDAEDYPTRIASCSEEQDCCVPIDV